MSTTTMRLSLAEAIFAANKFKYLFSFNCYHRWEYAGSLRRRCRDVGDIEHVVIPRFADLPGDDLYSTPKRVNLLLQRLDELVAQGTIARHPYANGQRWGEKYRGCDFDCLGVVSLHEIFCADETNWGPTLAIRTGPGEFSKQLVTRLLTRGRRNHQGFVWRCVPCSSCNPVARDPQCKRCQGTLLEPAEKLCVASEEDYFQLCGLDYLKPEDRK